MRGKSQQILFREMVLDLHYRLRLADDLFCNTAESLVAAAALEEWQSRSEVIQNIREYSQALQIINADLCRLVEGKRAIFPAELSEWIFDQPDGENKLQLHFERLHAIAEGLEMTVDREFLHPEFGHE